MHRFVAVTKDETVEVHWNRKAIDQGDEEA